MSRARSATTRAELQTGRARANRRRAKSHRRLVDKRAQLLLEPLERQVQAISSVLGLVGDDDQSSL